MDFGRLMATVRPVLVGTLGAWVLMSLATVLAWQRGDPASVAWLVWPASVIGAVIADRLMRMLERYRRLDAELQEVRTAMRDAIRRQGELTSALGQIRADAHRAAQPLTAAIGYTELLQKRCGGVSPLCDEQLTLLKEAVDRLADDLEALRNTARTTLE
jgi:signal transduction histidine kinase